MAEPGKHCEHTSFRTYPATAVEDGVPVQIDLRWCLGCGAISRVRPSAISAPHVSGWECPDSCPLGHYHA